MASIQKLSRDWTLIQMSDSAFLFRSDLVGGISIKRDGNDYAATIHGRDGKEMASVELPTLAEAVEFARNLQGV